MTSVDPSSSEPSPATELGNLLNRLEQHMQDARSKHYAPPEATVTPSRGLGRFLRREQTPPPPAKPTSPPTSPTTPSPFTGPNVQFIDFPNQEIFIEDLRRAAELCVIGENFVTSLQNKQDTKEQRDRERWEALRDGLDDPDFSNSEVDELENEKTMLFDIFFEREGLAMVVEMLHGERFRPPPTEESIDTDPNRTPTKNKQDPSPPKEPRDDSINETENEPTPPPTLLPPLPIATQVLQSICILIQNVSRAASLYVILSNNYINKLIDLPLDLYHAAEKRRLVESKEAKSLPAGYCSPAVTELSTHFVTFLKSLALRMNSETLQFFLKYPIGGISTVVSLEETPGLDNRVQFPLYERALEFCAAHHDSFIRTTALNICLNTLRLTTIDDEEEDGDEGKIDSGLKSPSGVLHNAKALEFQDRVIIAQFACIPSRVEHLISPICTKLAERWSALDEKIREIDANKHMGVAEATDDMGVRNERVSKAREKVRRDRILRAFRDKVADLQDDILLLDDVFKRLDASVDEDRFSFSDHPFGGFSADVSDVDKKLAPVSGPAKAALFTLSTVFQFVSNKPLLRLLFTLLIHPLAPDTTSAPSLRSKLEVATTDARGRRCIRLDSVTTDDERSTYPFGTSASSRRRSKFNLPHALADPDSEACVFVLAPALAEVLEYRGEDMSLTARSKTNPYRRALLKCLTVPGDMADVRDLAVRLVDSALAPFDSTFSAAILFGTDLKRFTDDMPADERNMDSVYAHSDDNRGIGGSAKRDSRQYVAPLKKGQVGSDLVAEVTTALCGCVVVAERVASDEWKLDYDPVACHALLAATRRHPGALLASSRLLEKKWRQAAELIASTPSSGLNPMGGSTIKVPGSPSINSADYEDRMFDMFLNFVFYDSLNVAGAAAAENLLQLKEVAETGSWDGFSVVISENSDFNSLQSCIGQFLVSEKAEAGLRSFDKEMVDERREGACCWFKIDALGSLLKELAATAGRSIQDRTLAGLAFHPDGTPLPLEESFDRKKIYANLSPTVIDALLSSSNEVDQPEFRSQVDTMGTLALPCVCEIAPSLAPYFSDGESGVVAEGVTWQSLFIVFVGQFLVFAQPMSDGTQGVGQVVATCLLERLSIDYDPSAPPDGSPARRLSLFYTWFDQTPPPLFLFDEVPEYEDVGPFVKFQPLTSRLDVWFESPQASNMAYDILTRQIFVAKAHRGRRLLNLLDPQRSFE